MAPMMVAMRPPLAARAALRGCVLGSARAPFGGLRGGLSAVRAPVARRVRFTVAASLSEEQLESEELRTYLREVVRVLPNCNGGGSADLGSLANALHDAGVRRPRGYGSLTTILCAFPAILSVDEGDGNDALVTLLRGAMAVFEPVRPSAHGLTQAEKDSAFIAGVVRALQRTGGTSNASLLAGELAKDGVLRPSSRSMWELLERHPDVVKISAGPNNNTGHPVVVTLLSGEPAEAAAPAPPMADAAPAAQSKAGAADASDTWWKNAAHARKDAVPPPLSSWESLSPRTPSQALYAEALSASASADPSGSSAAAFVVAVGPAGTGKTALAVAAGANALLDGTVSRLIITRPAVAADEDLGYLPGTAELKLEPYLQPIWDALLNVWPSASLKELMESRRLQVIPLGFMRGRTFDDSFVIADEMQNASQRQMTMLLSRLGRNSRMVLTGDLAQTDRHDSAGNGMAVLVKRLQAAAEKAADAESDAFVDAVRRDFALHVFDERSVQRHPAVRTALALMGTAWAE